MLKRITIAAITACFTVTLIAQVSGDVNVVKVGSIPRSEMKGPEYDIVGTDDFECIYEYVISSAGKDGSPFKETTNTILQMSPNYAKYQDYTTYRNDSLNFTKTPLTPENSSGQIKFTGEVYQNMSDGKTTYLDVVPLAYANYDEPFACFDWKLTEDTMTVCGYLCQKAMCEYGGRDWEVWFTEELPFGFGPWKFAGLPGLILKATDSKGVHDMTAIMTRKSDTFPILRQKYSKIQRTTRDKFLKVKADFEKDPMGAIPTEAVSSIDVKRNGEISINGVFMPQREHGYTPIELR